MKNKTSTIIAASLLVATANASTFIVEDFESYGPLYSDMNGKGGWTVSNGLDGLGDPVVIVNNVTWDTTLRSATIGGLVPTVAAPTVLSHSASLPLQSASSHVTTVRFELLYTESTDILKRNSFSIAVGTNAGNLLTVSFAPQAAGFYTSAWSSSFVTGASLGVVATGVPTEFTMTTFDDAGTMKYTLSSSGTPLSAGTLTGATPGTLINNFSATWDGTSAGGAGDGSFTIDRVVAIPEPSSLMLLGLSALGLIRRKR